jgi:Protein of unknown function (DUF1569)
MWKYLQEVGMPIDTAKVAGRRKVEYASLKELVADAERVTSGPFQTLGNWSAGQTFAHLARVINGSIDGIDHQAPWIFRFLAGFRKQSILRGPWQPGFQLPARAAAVLVPGPTSTEDGLAALRTAVARFEKERKSNRHPVLGMLTPDEWDQLHRVHGALHMSFLVPESQAPRA